MRFRVTDRRAAIIAGIIQAGLLIALFAPTLDWLRLTWQVHPFYSHGPLVPLIAGWFVWRNRSRLLDGSPSSAGVLLLAAGALLHVLSLRGGLWPVSAIGLIVALAGVAMQIGGVSGLRAVALPLLLLAMSVPLPIAERLAPAMAASVAHAAAVSASAAGAGVVRAGAQLTVGGGAFTVGEPCSGLRSLVALATLAMVVAGVADGPRQRRGVLVMTAVPLALGANWARLTGLILATDVLGPQRGLALFHSLASPMAFAAAAAALVGIGHMIGCRVRANL